MSTLRARAATLVSNLFRVGDRQPLAKPALVVLLFLDAFILVSIFDGLAEHTGQLATPADRVPAVCVSMVIERGWDETSRLDRLREAIPYDRSPYPDPPRVEVHPICAPLLAAVDAVGANAELAELLRSRAGVRRELQALEASLAPIRPANDTALLETIAGRPGVAIASIEAELRQKTAAQETLRATLRTLDAALLGAPEVAALVSRVAALRDADRLRLEGELRRLTFWFPLKRLGMELVFLVPLLGVFLAWTVRSARRGPGVQTLVASHLLFVAAIPVFLKVVEAVYEVIPKRLLAAVMALLVRLNLVAVWHYLVIAVAIGVALAVIYVVQRRLFSPERLAQRRISRGLCQDCGSRLPAGARACPACGFAQLRRCPACGGEAHVRAAHCAGCGADVRGGAPAVS
jgi:ribosomal protein L40E